MSTEDNKALIRRGYEGLNQRNSTAFYELFAPNVVFHNASMTTQGLEAYQQFLSMFLTAFPDFQSTIEDMIAEGDKVVTRQTFRGTHTGDLMGIPPTGKQVTMSGIVISQFVNGKCVELWANNDDLGLLQQLGVIPSMG